MNQDLGVSLVRFFSAIQGCIISIELEFNLVHHRVLIIISEKWEEMWTENRTLGNSFGNVTSWMTGNDAPEHKGVEELKWERKRGLSWDKMSKGEGSGQMKYILVSLCVSGWANLEKKKVGL